MGTCKEERKLGHPESVLAKLQDIDTSIKSIVRKLENNVDLSLLKEKEGEASSSSLSSSSSSNYYEEVESKRQQLVSHCQNLQRNEELSKEINFQTSRLSTRRE